MSKLYQKRPVVIRAMQYHGGNRSEVIDFMDNATDLQGTLMTDINGDGDDLFIETLEGVFHVSPGDYVIRGVMGEYYPCREDIFKATYELLED